MPEPTFEQKVERSTEWIYIDASSFMDQITWAEHI